MANIIPHGGSCCGMRHISGFRDNPETNVAQLIAKTSENQIGDGRYQLEVILSDRQTRENPGLIEQLARLGYVYTSCWTGQHGTPVHLFLRAKGRLALSDANFYNRWVNDLNGMLPHPDLAGNLPALAEVVQVVQVVAPRTQWRVGSRVRCNVLGSINYGRVGVIEGMADPLGDRWSGGTVRYVETGRLVRYGVLGHSFELLPPEAPAQPAPAPEPRVYRHPNADQATFRDPAQPVPDPTRRLILSQFYCVFRATGQASRVFATLAEAQAAYPQALDWHERKVYSDGEIVEGPVQHG